MPSHWWKPVSQLNVHEDATQRGDAFGTEGHPWSHMPQ